MFAEKPILRLIDAGGEKSRPTLIGMNALEQAAMRRPDFGLAGARRKAKDLVGLLISHGARIRRATRPRTAIFLSVFTPTGEPAVHIGLDERH